MRNRDLVRPLPFAFLSGLAGAVGLAVMLAVVSAVGLVERSTFDVTEVYRPVGEVVVGGGVPYRDIAIEYPPGALAAFVAPSLLADGEVGYRAVFVLSMLLCAAVALGSVAWLLVAWLGCTRREALLRVAVAAGMLVALGSVSLTRFDLLPVALLMLALALVARGLERTGAVALGAAVATKIFPGAVLPLVAAWAWRRRGQRRAVEVVVICLGVAALAFVPFLAVAPGAALEGVTRQLERPLEAESLGASVVVLADWLGLGEVSIVGSFGSTNVEGAGVGPVEVLSSLVALALVVGIWARFAARREPEPAALVTASAVSIAVLLAFAKVLSAQFLVWLVPLVVLVPGRNGTVARALTAAACVLTAVWFPELFRQVAYEESQAPFAVVMVRNALLVAVAVVLLLLPEASTARRAEPARSPSPAPL